MTTEATASDDATQPGAVALTEGLGLVPDATWAAVERYADEVHDFNVAVKIDVGVDKASAKCLKAEADARSAILAFAAEQVAAERERCAKLCEAKARARRAWWDSRADPADQGAAMASDELADEIRA